MLLCFGIIDAYKKINAYKGRYIDMITGELKNKIDRIWDDFAAGGITNTIDVLEQFTYLLFIKSLDEIDQEKESNAMILGIDYDSIFPKTIELNNVEVSGDRLRWNVFKNYPAEEMLKNYSENVFPFMKTMHGNEESAYAKYMGDSINKIASPALLQKVVSGIDGLPTDKADMKGDIYEYVLSKLSTSGRNGQFRTPRHIIDMMVRLIEPNSEDQICDPACGTAGFLVSSEEYIQEAEPDLFYDEKKKENFEKRMFNGFDTDTTMLRISAMNMMMHGVEDPNIRHQDSLSSLYTEENKYSVVLANPPFKGSLDHEAVSDTLLKVCKTKKTELLFLTLFLRILKVGGRCSCIVPDGVLFGSSKAHKEIRKKIVEDNMLEGVISMPSGVFKPYAGVSTAILIFSKTGTGGTDQVWFYDMKADGYSLDDKRSKVEENDIPDIIERFHHLDKEKDRKRTEQSFFVDKDEIVKNDYDLSINKYKEIVYEKIEYPPTSEILANIEQFQKEIDEGLAELKELLKDTKVGHDE